jgi:hypothetical protein
VLHTKENQLKITYTSKGHYSEISQPNPIRWAILSGTPETGFVNESSWLKCKDFFNDYVVAYNGGKRFNIYGFSTVGMNIPEKGMPVYIAVKDLTSEFLNNLTTINEKLPRSIKWHKADDGTIVLELDSFYFECTYNISLISLMIRLCNIKHTFSSFDEFYNYKSYAAQDQNLWNNVVSKGVMFNLPETLRQYVWYAGKDHNSEQKVEGYSLASLVHNNGIISYSAHF